MTRQALIDREGILEGFLQRMSCPQDLCKHIKKIKPDLLSLFDMPNIELSMKRRKLVEYMHGLKPGTNAQIIQRVLGVIKFICEDRYQFKGDHSKHVITDHAFCAGLHRYMGIDIENLKDKMHQLACNENWNAVVKDGRIVTFIAPDMVSATGRLSQGQSGEGVG